jgi:hypothetical protein
MEINTVYISSVLIFFRIKTFRFARKRGLKGWPKLLAAAVLAPLSCGMAFGMRVLFHSARRSLDALLVSTGTLLAVGIAAALFESLLGLAKRRKE